MKTALITLLAVMSLTACKEPATQTPASVVAPQVAAPAASVAIALPQPQLSKEGESDLIDVATVCRGEGAGEQACLANALKYEEDRLGDISGGFQRGEWAHAPRAWLDDYYRHQQGAVGQLSELRQCQQASQGNITSLIRCAIAEREWYDRHVAKYHDYEDREVKAKLAESAKILNKIPTKSYDVQGD